jgi:hypothetical protein
MLSFSCAYHSSSKKYSIQKQGRGLDFLRAIPAREGGGRAGRGALPKVPPFSRRREFDGRQIINEAPTGEIAWHHIIAELDVHTDRKT